VKVLLQPVYSVLFFFKVRNFRAGITESQYHRIVGVGRDLFGSSSPTPLPKQGHLQ